MKSQVCPLLNSASSASLGLRFPLAFLLPRACPLSSEFFRLHLAAVARVPGSPKTSPARCRVGCAPLSPASSFFVSLRRASCLPSPRPLNGSSLLMNLCDTLPGGMWCRSWPSTSAALLTDKRRIPLRSASVRTPHLFHHGIPKVLVNPRSKGITSVRSTTTH
jgi:hypothetical protein